MFILFTSILAFSLASSLAKGPFEVAFQWNYINYTWPSEQTMSASGYVPGEDVIAGIKIYENVIYLALPRIKPSSRVTLASIPIDANKENPLLSPFPSWEMNSGSTCDALQNVMSMEIDKDGVMWIIDARRVDNNTLCPPKILLIDLHSPSKPLQSFNVPSSLCPNPCFLNDIVVDDDFAYISDTTSSDPGIFIYHRKSNTAWKARDKTMFGVPEAINFTAQGVQNRGLSHINGIALCCVGEEERTFFFMPQTSFHIFSIATSVLKNRSLASGDVHDFIEDRGTKQGQSGGMVCDTKDDIYYGVLPMDAVGKWNVEKRLEESELVEVNHEIIRWPDSFSIYGGELFLITNSMSKFSAKGIDKSEINFRIIKMRTDSKSYIYC